MGGWEREKSGRESEKEAETGVADVLVSRASRAVSLSFFPLSRLSQHPFSHFLSQTLSHKKEITHEFTTIPHIL